MTPKPQHTPGPCLWCNQQVTSQRKEAGAPARTAAFDACWATEDGDYGCDRSPETCKEGVGQHITMSDVRRMVLERAAAPAMREALALITKIAERESVGGKDAPDAYGTIGRQARAALRLADGGK